MAVTKIVNIQRFLGLSSDDKPTSVDNGSIFIETDTADVFTTVDNGTNWIKYCRNSAKNTCSESIRTKDYNFRI